MGHGVHALVLAHDGDVGAAESALVRGHASVAQGSDLLKLQVSLLDAETAWVTGDEARASTLADAVGRGLEAAGCTPRSLLGCRLVRLRQALAA